MNRLYPLPTNLLPIPENELLPPRYFVSVDDSQAQGNGKYLTPSGSFRARVGQNLRITPPGHWQDVRHIILECNNPEMYYEPGDVAVVWPENPKEEVDIFLDILHWTEIAERPLAITDVTTGNIFPSIHLKFRTSFYDSVQSTDATDLGNDISRHLFRSPTILL